MATNYENLVELFQVLFTEVLEAQREYKRGLLGNSAGEIAVTGRADFVWVREDKFSTKVWQVFNKRILGVEAGTPVLIGELPWQPGLVQVVDVDWRAYARMDWSADYAAIPAHYTTHQYPSEVDKGPDAVRVYLPAIQPLKTTADGLSLNVTVQAYSYYYNDSYRTFLGNIVNLASYLPTTAGKAKFILLYLDKSSNLLTITSGTEVTDSTAITAPKPDLPDNAIPSAYIRLAYGQTVISSTTGAVDARELLNSVPDATTSNSAGLSLVRLLSGESLTVPVTHQMVVHEDDFINDGDLTLSGDFIFDKSNLTDTPASASASGEVGQWAFTDGHIYFCVAEDTWQRVAIVTW